MGRSIANREVGKENRCYKHAALYMADCSYPACYLNGGTDVYKVDWCIVARFCDMYIMAALVKMLEG